MTRRTLKENHWVTVVKKLKDEGPASTMTLQVNQLLFQALARAARDSATSQALSVTRDHRCPYLSPPDFRTT
ncbi:hypothetical protein NP233_g11399 [Leucocoprinus birnbaumii]|uniref:Uncharacterized protein n=1 Tax=Leucocoprinus birnbaumii TaxID=56174 RepID=A0AAD5VHG8_9AGAR|nr:hypothetical protein NP233_g11399 [Leucocoprinus birnbaumii]